MLREGAADNDALITKLKCSGEFPNATANPDVSFRWVGLNVTKLKAKRQLCNGGY